MAEFSIAGLTYKNLALKGSKDAQGIWRYTDPLDNSDYAYNPVSGTASYMAGAAKPAPYTGISFGGGFGGAGAAIAQQAASQQQAYRDAVANSGKSLVVERVGGDIGNSGSSTTSSSNSLFGTGGYLGTGVNFDDYVNKMKELTDWRLGIDKRSMENAYGFRDKEATRDYGFQTGLAGQQIQGQKDIQGQQIEGTKNLETLRNEYMNKRQSEQLANQRAMQEAGFGQQNKLLTDNANRAKSLYFGGR